MLTSAITMRDYASRRTTSTGTMSSGTKNVRTMACIDRVTIAYATNPFTARRSAKPEQGDVLYSQGMERLAEYAAELVDVRNRDLSASIDR